MRFNNEVVPRYMADTIWAFTAPASSVSLSGPDTAAYESDGVHSYFPHRLSDITAARDPTTLRAWIERTPLADAAVLDFAETMALSRTRPRRIVRSARRLRLADGRRRHEFGPSARNSSTTFTPRPPPRAFFAFSIGTVGRTKTSSH